MRLTTALPALLVTLIAGGCGVDTDLMSLFGDKWKQTASCDLTAVEVTSVLDLPATPFDYANQAIPAYIRKDNSGANPVTDLGAMLGRVLFYDTRLSSDNTVSCASCHQQAYAFGDTDRQSEGVNGLTARHAMRLVNARFGEETHYFWDERAASLEEQHLLVLTNHIEMGNSGTDGDPSIDDLAAELQDEAYYQNLFTCAFGDPVVTEGRIRTAIAQFVQSIQSFDSKYDDGRSQVGGDVQDFPNFTAQENLGKHLYLAPPNFNQNGVRVSGGLGCQGCHQAPEFDIDPNSQNNGVIGTIGGSGIDLTVTRSPTMRDIVRADGTINGSFMHSAIGGMDEMLDHYDEIEVTGANNQLDPRLAPNHVGQQLMMALEERDAVKAFLRTLTGSDVYTNEKWSDPFK